MTKRYSAYNESGVDWIGEIPEHWGRKSLKYIATLKSGSNLTSDDITPNGQYPVYGGNGLRGYYHQYTHEGLFPLIGRQGALCGNIHYGKDKFWHTEHSVVVDINDGSDPKYIGELLRSMNLNRFSVSAAQPGLSVEVIRNINIPYPPLPEQKAIARYLDQKTDLIDDLIEKTTQKIALLREQRTAIINQAVTKGLYPNVQMKDSGIEWIGEIPEHWKANRLKFSFVVLKDQGINNEVKIGLEHIESGTGALNYFKSDYDGIGVYFQPDDILFGKLRPYLAKVFIANIEGQAVGDFFVLRCKTGMYPKYGHLLLLSHGFIDQCNSSTFGAKMPRVNWDFMSNVTIPLPPLQEQETIVNFIEQKTNEIDRLIKKQDKAMELLKEYRRALISEVVTGKICVLDEVPETAKTFS